MPHARLLPGILSGFILILYAACAQAQAVGTLPNRDPASRASADGAGETRSAKERLSDKASDEQRVNDCKVPADRRGTRTRPQECGGDAGPAAPRVSEPR